MFRQVTTYMNDKIARRVDRRGYSLEAIVVAVCGLLGSIGFAYVWMGATGALEHDSTMLEYELFAEVITPVVLLIGLWIWYTIGTHFVANYFNGRGPISRLFRGAAWSLIPIGVWYLVRSVVIIALFYDEEFPGEPEGLGASEQLRSILEVGLDSPVYVATMLAGVLFTVWSAHLLSTAVQQAKGISADEARTAAAVVAAPFALYLVWLAIQWL